jgi:small subunit ribosomal protein S20
MPRSKSVLKRYRQNEKRRLANRYHRSNLKTQIKKLKKTIEEKDVDAAQRLLQPTISTIDKTAQKGVIHQNTASRYKSNLTSKINVLLSEKKSG